MMLEPTQRGMKEEGKETDFCKSTALQQDSSALIRSESGV